MSTGRDDLRIDVLLERVADSLVSVRGPGCSDAPNSRTQSSGPRQKFGIELWSKQREIAQSVRENRRTAVRSCRDAGRSSIASVIAVWWIDTDPPGETFIASGAPTYPQAHT